jgi:hypothetical protein
MLDLSIFGLTKRQISGLNKMTKKEVQTDHIVSVVDSFFGACTPNNVVQSFRLVGISLEGPSCWKGRTKQDHVQHHSRNRTDGPPVGWSRGIPTKFGRIWGWKQSIKPEFSTQITLSWLIQCLDHLRYLLRKSSHELIVFRSNYDASTNKIMSLIRFIYFTMMHRTIRFLDVEIQVRCTRIASPKQQLHKNL